MIKFLRMLVKIARFKESPKQFGDGSLLDQNKKQTQQQQQTKKGSIITCLFDFTIANYSNRNRIISKNIFSIITLYFQDIPTHFMCNTLYLFFSFFTAAYPHYGKQLSPITRYTLQFSFKSICSRAINKWNHFNFISLTTLSKYLSNISTKLWTNSNTPSSFYNKEKQEA